MRKIVIACLTIVALCLTAQARDPYWIPPDYEYDERETIGGSEWTGGDTFIAIALPIAVAMVIALPHIFSGNRTDECAISPLSINKFQHFTQKHASNYEYKFPTRRLCGSY